MAIKMVTRVFDKVSLAKRALRELTLLRHFNNHENITGLIDVDAIAPGFNEMCVLPLTLSVRCVKALDDSNSYLFMEVSWYRASRYFNV